MFSSREVIPSIMPQTAESVNSTVCASRPSVGTGYSLAPIIGAPVALAILCHGVGKHLILFTGSGMTKVCGAPAVGFPGTFTELIEAIVTGAVHDLTVAAGLSLNHALLEAAVTAGGDVLGGHGGRALGVRLRGLDRGRIGSVCDWGCGGFDWTLELEVLANIDDVWIRDAVGIDTVQVLPAAVDSVGGGYGAERVPVLHLIRGGSHRGGRDEDADVVTRDAEVCCVGQLYFRGAGRCRKAENTGSCEGCNARKIPNARSHDVNSVDGDSASS